MRSQTYHRLFDRTLHFIQPLDLETPGRVEERREEILRDVDLAGVGELERRRGLVPSGVLQDDDRMLARCLL